MKTKTLVAIPWTETKMKLPMHQVATQDIVVTSHDTLSVKMCRRHTKSWCCAFTGVSPTMKKNLYVSTTMKFSVFQPQWKLLCLNNNENLCASTTSKISVLQWQCKAQWMDVLPQTLFPQCAWADKTSTIVSVMMCVMMCVICYYLNTKIRLFVLPLVDPIRSVATRDA